MNKTSRRSLLGAAAALLTALLSWGATSRKASTIMQTGTSTARAPSRKVARVLGARAKHWVGDGFLVHSVFSPDGEPAVQSPFLLLDHAARHRFEPASERRGVGEHPHRGFETVTFAYRGEIEHRDSAGGGGIIGPGDVQWMTAASGIVHEEKHSARFTKEGGELEMVQLWVNLPARAKMSPPGYQSLLDREFPRVRLGAAEARVVAGGLLDARGPAKTHTPITIFDLTFDAAGQAEFSLPRSYNAMVFALEGALRIGDEARAVEPGHAAVLEKSDALVRLTGEPGTRALVLGGEPIDEPIVAYGPFVMNTRAQIMQAMRDYQSGQMGRLD